MMKTSTVKLVILSEDQSALDMMSQWVKAFSDERFSLVISAVGEVAERQLYACDFDICFADARYESSEGVTVVQMLECFNECGCEQSVILWDPEELGHVNELIRSGVADYLLRGELDPHQLESYTYYALYRQDVIDHADRMSIAYKNLFDHALIGIFQSTPGGNYIRVNDTLANIYGYTSSEALREELTDIAGQLYIDHSRREQFKEMMERDGIVRDFESQIFRRDGEVIWIREHARKVVDRNGHLLYYEGFVEDITERKKIDQRLRYEARHDALTGLPNRVQMLQHLNFKIKRMRHGEDFALLYMDLNNFKVVNDSLGHSAGDTLLTMVATRLRKALRVGDVIARLGGDEFAVLINDINSYDDVTHTVSRLHKELTTAFILEQREVLVGAAIGVVHSHDRYEDAEQILRDADTAMYSAKKDGQPFAIADEHTHDEMVNRLELEIDLRKTLDRKDLMVYYQPILDLKNERVFSLESLVRWDHQTRGMISPGEFIPIANEAGVISEIDWFVLETSCRQMLHWHGEKITPYSFKINVNMNVRTLEDINFMSRLTQVLELTGLPSHLLCIEIIEGTMMDSKRDIVPTLLELHELGVELHIDDFGTGYSSLSRLHSLPFDVIKADQQFMFRMTDERSSKILETVFTLAKALDMRTVAEGVETVDQLQWVKDRGCELVQGYLFAKPMPGDAIPQAIAQMDYVQTGNLAETS